MVILITMLEKLLEEFQKGCLATLEKISIAIFINFLEAGHQALEISDYQIIGNRYGNNRNKPKITEALLIKELKPALNKQDKSIPLKLLH